MSLDIDEPKIWEAARRVLKQEGQPRHVREIRRLIEERSYFEFGANEANHSSGPPKGLNVRQRANRVFGSSTPIPQCLALDLRDHLIEAGPCRRMPGALQTGGVARS
jgi:hypothetical protein